MVDCVLPRYLRKVDLRGSSTKIEGSSEDSIDNKRESLMQKMSETVHQVKWLPNFVALPGHWLLSDIEKTFAVSYKDLNLYPMDISSALPVLALNINPNEPAKIMDLCCCPGGKLQYLREAAGDGSFVIGVDIAEMRLNVCRSLLHRYQSRMRVEDRRKKRLLLFNCDGCSFSSTAFGKLLYDSDIILNLPNNDKFKLNKSTKKRYERELDLVLQQLRRTGQDTETRSSPLVDLDYVLVDAECTHDASYRHLRHINGRNKWNKRRRSGEEGDFWDEEFDFEALNAAETAKESSEEPETEEANTAHLSHGIPLLPAHNMDVETSGNEDLIAADQEGRKKLQTLQRRLLQNGFESLRNGGVLVYSTCSSDVAQNEEIVQWLLETDHRAILEPALPHLFPPEGSVVPADVAQILRDAEQGVLQSKESASEVYAAAEKLCSYFAQLERPWLQHGSLPGTIRVGFTAGMSGHFVARIRKNPTPTTTASSV